MRVLRRNSSIPRQGQAHIDALSLGAQAAKIAASLGLGFAVAGSAAAFLAQPWSLVLASLAGAASVALAFTLASRTPKAALNNTVQEGELTTVRRFLMMAVLPSVPAGIVSGQFATGMLAEIGAGGPGWASHAAVTAALFTGFVPGSAGMCFLLALLGRHLAARPAGRFVT